jgi:sulfur carrier protein
MKLTVNGKETTIADGNISITQLLETLQVAQRDYVTVELNGDILDRDDFESAGVKNGDTVEFLYFMGGGAA